MATAISLRSRLVGSPCCLPSLALPALLSAYRDIGFTRYEAFSSWAAARHDWTGDPLAARAEAAAYGMRITSYHLPKIDRDVDGGLRNALAAAQYASRLGDGVVVLFKAESKALFAQTARRFLDLIERQGLDVVPALQNHYGTAISSLQDFEQVLRAVDDPRMQAVLEVGHFQRAGVHWRDGWELLRERIALIHLSDIRLGQSAPFGAGEVDMAGLMQQIKRTAYAGNIVVELELATHATQLRLTLDGLRDAADLLCKLYDAA